MSPKRGRPPSYTDDDTVKRRRQLTAARTRAYRQRRQNDSSARVPSTPQPSLQYGERIVNLTFTEWDAAETLATLGLRTQGLTLPQEPQAAQQQAQAVPIDEHYDLYRSRLTTHHGASVEEIPPREEGSSHANEVPARLPFYFPTQPPRNPFRDPAEPPIHTSPSDQASAEPLSLMREVRGPHGGRTLGSEDLLICPNDSNDEEWEGFNDDGEGHDDNDDDDDDDIVEPEDQPLDRVESDDLVAGQRAIDDSVEDPETSIEVTTTQISSTEDAAQVDNDGEDSPYSFASEHSTASDGDDDEVDPVLLVAQKLLNHLQLGFQGCSFDRHDDALRQHREEVGNEHHSLDDIFNDATFPSVLALRDMISAERLARQPVPSPAQWQSMFCGIPLHSPRSRPVHVCLHQEQTQAVTPQVAFDVDSFLGFSHTLAVARKGLWYQPAPQMRQNMTNDVHLETTKFQYGDDPEQPPRATLVLLRDVPHFLLGRIAGAHDITVHVLFPHLSDSRDKFISLTHHDYTRWFDRVFHPAVHHHCAAHYSQHLPASFRQAFANSKAHQVEGRKVETASYQAQQAIGYHLQPHQLGLIWSEVLATTQNTPGVADFRDPELFFSAKGTKLHFKSTPHQPSLLDVMEHFESYLSDVLDLEHIDRGRLFIDIGKEICPGVSLLATQAAGVDEQPQVYSWKRCCLQEHVQKMYDGAAPASGASGQRYYDQNMLRDASSVTSVPPKSSLLYQGGVRYFQLYGSVKEVWDAAKCIPFGNDGLEEMALDPTIRQGARHLAAGRSREANIVETAYCASKRRAHYALTDCRQKSYGVREEYRISWSLYHALMRRLRWYPQEELEISLPDCPSYVWPIKTEVYLNFLWRSADKFASGFEVVRARCRPDLVTWEQTKMMAMFLRCLRFVLGGHQLSRESALWWSRREREVGDPPHRRVWYGLGFSNTLPRYGYCWLEPRFDWSQLTFQPTMTDQVLFGNNMLRGRYLRRGRRVQEFFDATKDLELALTWLDRHQAHVPIRNQLVFWIIHLCLRQFRMDVLGSIPSEIREHHRQEALTGLHAFYYEYFDEIMERGVYLTAGNRSDFKVASHLGHYLFDLDDGRQRQHWDHKPFRQLYRRARTALRARFGRSSEIYQAFRRRFWRYLFAYHWILPQPSPQVLLQVTKQNQRMWYSIRTEETGPVHLLEPKQWAWGRKDWQAGQPPGLPPYLTWQRDDWEDWMAQQEGLSRAA